MKQTAFYTAGLVTLLAGAFWALPLGSAWAQVPPAPQNLTPHLTTPRAGAPATPAAIPTASGAAPANAPLSASVSLSGAAQPSAAPRGAAPAQTMALLPENLQTDTLTLVDIRAKLDATPDDLSFMMNRLRDLELGRSVIQHENASAGRDRPLGLGG